jgi:hypothetical protein
VSSDKALSDRLAPFASGAYMIRSRRRATTQTLSSG